GTTYRIQTQALGTPVDTILYLWAPSPDGPVLVDLNDDANGRSDRTSEILYRAPVSGPLAFSVTADQLNVGFRVLVDDALVPTPPVVLTPTQTPTRTLTPTRTTTRTATPTRTQVPPSLQVPDAFEPDSAAPGTALLNVGGAAIVRTFHVKGDVDHVRFVA